MCKHSAAQATPTLPAAFPAHRLICQVVHLNVKGGGLCFHLGTKYEK